MSERYSTSPQRVSLLKNIYDASTFYAPSFSEAGSIAHSILRVSGVLEESAAEVPVEIQAETIAASAPQQWYVSYLAQNTPGYHDTRDNLLSFTFSDLHPQPGVGVRALGIMPTLEAAAGVPVQAFERRMTLKYDQPRSAIQAASELALADVDGMIIERARRRTFAGMVTCMSELVNYHKAEKDIPLRYIQNAIPEALVSARDLHAQMREDALDPRRFTSKIADMAHAIYMYSSPERQTQLIEATSAELERIYDDIQQGSAKLFEYPHTFTFGPEVPYAAMSDNQALSVPLTWEGPVLDDRLVVATRLRFDGVYDLRAHTFTPVGPDHSFSSSSIEFILKRAAIRADSTENSLGPVLDEQMHAIAGDLITTKTWDEYQQSLEEVTPVPFERRKAVVVKAHSLSNEGNASIAYFY